MALRVMSMAEMRLEVLLEAARSGETVSEVCRRFGISRKTYYVYLRRYQAEGVEGLEPRSRVPRHQPGRMPGDVELEICRLRKDHPKWGARRIRAELTRAGVAAPAVSSIHQALVRNYLVALQPKRPRKADRRFEREAANDLWQIDATRFVLAGGDAVWVMDMVDDHARFLLAARVAESPSGEAAWACFEWAVVRYGLPKEVLSDNGTCFTGRLKNVEVVFERRLRLLGVKMLNSRPYHPQTLGKLERYHRTFKEWMGDVPVPATMAELQDQLDRFRDHYNVERPHQGIADDTPAERYDVAAPTMPSPEAPVEEPSYPTHAIVRTVNRNGVFGFQGYAIGVGKRWGGKRVQVIELGGIVHAYYGDRLLRSLVIDTTAQFQGRPGTVRYPQRRTRTGKPGRSEPGDT
jgi:transposase InsO family protein